MSEVNMIRFVEMTGIYLDDRKSFGFYMMGAKAHSSALPWVGSSPRYLNGVLKNKTQMKYLK